MTDLTGYSQCIRCRLIGRPRMVVGFFALLHSCDEVISERMLVEAMRSAELLARDFGRHTTQEELELARC